MSKMFMKDSTGKSSVTTTVFIMGFIVVCVKLLLSGMSFWGFEIPVFTGIEASAVIAALGGVYVLRRKPVPNEQKGETK